MSEIDIILNSKSLLVMLLVPSLAVGLLLITLTYKLVIKMLDDFGKPYIESQRQQAVAFMKVAEQLEASRITLSAIVVKVDSIEDKLNGVRINGNRNSEA